MVNKSPAVFLFYHPRSTDWGSVNRLVRVESEACVRVAFSARAGPDSRARLFRISTKKRSYRRPNWIDLKMFGITFSACSRQKNKNIKPGYKNIPSRKWCKSGGRGHLHCFHLFVCDGDSSCQCGSKGRSLKKIDQTSWLNLVENWEINRGAHSKGSMRSTVDLISERICGI